MLLPMGFSPSGFQNFNRFQTQTDHMRQMQGFPLRFPPSTFPLPQQFLPPNPLKTEPTSPSPKRPKIFRPWQTEEDRKPDVPRFSPPRVCGSRNDKVVVRSDDPFLKEQSALEVIATNLGKSRDGGHRCIYCGKVYSRKYGLKIHLRTHTGFKPLKCRVCDRAFGDPSNLNKHTRLHADNNALPSAFNCELCGKILPRKRDLERHLTARHGSEEEDSVQVVDVESP